MRTLLVVVLLGAFGLTGRGLPAGPWHDDSDAAYEATGRLVNGLLLIRNRDLITLDPCSGGTRDNAAWLLGMRCRTQGFPNPFSAPVVLVVVRQETELRLAVVAAPDSLLENYVFTGVAPGTYSFQTNVPITGIGEAAVRLYLDEEFAGEAETNLMTLGGLK